MKNCNSAIYAGAQQLPTVATRQQTQSMAVAAFPSLSIHHSLISIIKFIVIFTVSIGAGGHEQGLMILKTLIDTRKHF